MFKNILTPLDGSPMADRILPHVAALAHKDASAITLLRVLESDGKASTPVIPLDWHFAKAEAQAHLDEAAKQLAKLGLACSTVLLEGAAARSIVEFAHKNAVDLIVLSSHGHGGLSGWNVSGVAQKVIHRAGTSILLIRSSDGTAEEHRADEPSVAQYHTILAPLDGSTRAEGVLPLARALAERHAAELKLVHVVARPEMFQHLPLSQDDVALADRVVARNKAAAEKYFDQLQSWLPSKAQTRVLVDESTTRALDNIVEKENVDLVLLCAHGHSCHVEWPYSSLVTSFIAYGASSLLILQDLPSSLTPNAMVEHNRQDVTMPTRRANVEEGRTTSAQP